MNVSKPESLAKLVERIAKFLVDDPNGVTVSEKIGEQTTVIELTVSKQDIGKIIGKQGRTAQSIRTLLNCASTKLNRKTVLEIVE